MQIICEKLGIKNTCIDLDFMNKYFKSDLLKSGGEIPEGAYNADNMESTVVPFRNGIMLAIAAGLAESRCLDVLVLGNHSGDHTIYPDCRPKFIAGIEDAIFHGTSNNVKVISPFCDITKTDIVKLGKKLGVDFSLTYSCYKGGEKHCGKCGTCQERIEAFHDARVKDPTIYE
ncbi:MAG: 7-cyano-7-deazaguanine synthase [Phascolarctobacterium sp.]|nr:7-cyano-7-deazaguanine synthase [Phascolarctobacterium sp.]